MREIAELIRKGNVVFFCGSGLSVASGIPTFRGDDGLWQKYDPNLYVSADGILDRLINHPEELRGFLLEFYGALLAAKPNPAHGLIATWENKGYVTGVITQNVDDLAQAAGSLNVCELHGNAYAFTCRHCDYVMKKSRGEWEKFIDRLKFAVGKRIIKMILDFAGVCSRCHNRRESAIVLFGQPLPEKEVVKGYKLLTSAKTLICVGTGSVVFPAAAFPQKAKEHGATIVNINPAPTPLDEISDFVCREKAVAALEKISLHL